MKYRMLIIIFIAFIGKTYAQENIQKDTVRTTAYSFLFMDNPQQLYTMRQFNENYLSAYRLVVRGLDNNVKPYYSMLIQFAAGIITMPLTHEEGHRSILTAENIGSISQPYFNSKGAAYVKGVRDTTLIILRDTELPTYIRLHTAGLESDYMLIHRMENYSAFEKDESKRYIIEYAYRKLSHFYYYFSSLFPGLGFEHDEETNELERDIVGHDVYGAIRHLHRPNMEFYRYTKYDDLTKVEEDFVKRVGYRSLLNLLTPFVIGKNNFEITSNLKANFGFGYTMSPFGDFIDENLWLSFNDKLNIHTYFRQFQNRDTWFYGGGINLVDYPVHDKVVLNLSGHVWQQPQNLDFNTSSSFWGGSGDAMLRYKLFNKSRNESFDYLSFDIGIGYKTYGYLPEELYFDETFSLRFGTTLSLK